MKKENLELRERISRYEHPKDSHNSNSDITGEELERRWQIDIPPQMFVAFSCSGTLKFSGTLIVSWTQARPSGKFSAVFKGAHITSRFGCDYHCRYFTFFDLR